ncbi:glycosyltransferase [Brenneria goodwinii]|uniref:glycosyltransferase n=1 Tax=Brenneria goodwinii TaxID=1109412 RepID=UPI0036E101BF
MAGSPLVSIVIPAYKSAFFEATLHSACNQDYDNIEIVICDDSQGDLIKICVDQIRPYSHFPILYHQNEKNLGETDNTIKGLKLASGEYIKFLHDDDLLRENCVSRMVEALESSNNVALVSSRRRRIDEADNVLPDTRSTAYPFKGDSLIRGQDVINFVADNTINFIGEPSCTLIRRQDLLAMSDELYLINGQRAIYLGDLVLYVKLLRLGDLVILAEPLVDFRVSTEQYSHKARIHRATEGDKALVGYTVLRQTIRDLGWYQGTPGEKNRYVGVAPLNKPDSLLDFDLLEGIIAAYGRQEVGMWLNHRQVMPSEQRLIQQYLTEHTEGRNFCVVVLDLGTKGGKLSATLESFSSLPWRELNVRLVILTDQQEVANLYPDEDIWLAAPEAFIDSLNQIVESYQFDWLLLLRSGEQLMPNGLPLASVELTGAEALHAVYGDEVVRASDGSLGVRCRPDFNLDYFLSLPSAMIRHWLLRRDTVRELGGFSAGYERGFEFEFIVRLIEKLGVGRIGHLAEFLTIIDEENIHTLADEVRVLESHLLRRGYENGKVTSHLPGHYRLHYGHSHQPLVSIIIPTKDRLPMLVACVTSLMEKTRYKNYELLIVDNHSETPEAQQWLAGLAKVNPQRIRVLSYPHPFNFSAMNNLAAREAHGDYLLLLNNDTAVIQPDWLDNMLNHAQRPEVGIVGAKLLYPDGRIQHGGVVMGIGPTEVADHPFAGSEANKAGYMQRLLVDQNYTVVSAACLMIRKSVYFEVNGLDEQVFKTKFSDVDLCLKVSELGYLTVWTPFALLIHEGQVSLQTVDKTALQSERKSMHERWLPQIVRDPAYSPHFSFAGRGFTLEDNPRLGWRALSWRPLPVVMALPVDHWGCGHYRVRQPFAAMKEANLIDGVMPEGLLTLPQLTRYAPDVLLFQRLTKERFHQWASYIKTFNHSFKIYEYDDYSPAVPLKSVHYREKPKDMLRLIRKSLSFADRFIVSTEPLAEAFAGTHPDIRVMENKLPIAWWGNLRGLRRQGRKPRVGWAGAISHTGDLEMVSDVVRDLADEVEWVFFGMCPDKLRPWVHEYHPGVLIEQYPAKLASLNLDLAIAPLEDNLFNRCKSNLRLLEFGACGFPVVCTDISPFQCGLPVTRVRNRYKDWMDVIRAHLADLDATAHMGDELQATIHRDWMLTGENVGRWHKVWLPD